MRELMYGQCPKCGGNLASCLATGCPREVYELQHTKASDPDAAGWNYYAKPATGTDARKLVTLLQDGMVWVGIRAWHSQDSCWYNGNDPEHAEVLAWQDIPEPAQHRWSGGILV